MMTFKYDRTYKYKDRLVVYRKAQIFCSFRYLDTGDKFLLEPDFLGLVSEVPENQQVVIPAPANYNQYQPTVMPSRDIASPA